MKKSILYSTLISVGITSVLCAINWILALTTGEIMGIFMHGGEYVAQCGFGVIVETFYPMSSFEDPVGPSTQINPEPISFIVTLLAVFVVAFIISRIIAKKKA